MASVSECVRLGYIPVSFNDPGYIRERSHEIEAGMSPCACSNCAKPEAATLLDNLVFANKDNFDQIISDQFLTSETHDIGHKYPSKQTSLRKRKIPDADRPEFDSFKCQLISNSHDDYISWFGPGLFPPGDVFGNEEAEAIVCYMHHINTVNDLRGIIGGKCYDGQLDWLLGQIFAFKSTVGDKGCLARQKKPRSALGIDHAPSGSEVPLASGLVT
jgi:hypothetical protein